jgi:hypothetical protein
MLSKERDRLVIAGSRNTAVFITTGCSYQCSLVQPGYGGSASSQYRVRKISMFPFTQEYERSMACIANVLDIPSFYGAMSGGALTFSTRKENTTGSIGMSCVQSDHVDTYVIGSLVSGPSTPKAKSLFSKVESTSQSQGWAGSRYPSAFNFEDRGTITFYIGFAITNEGCLVPIYDGRGTGDASFSFRGADFDHIKSLPLYQKGTIDLPMYSVISVGYAASSYGYTTGGMATGALALSLNVLFVIVLGVPNI